MASTQCFQLIHTGRTVRSLRRYENGTCPGRGYHNAKAEVARIEGQPEPMLGRAWPVGDPRWPAACEACGHVFTEAAERQVFDQDEYQREGCDEFHTLADAPVGAMWWADWHPPMSGSKIHRSQRGGGAHLIVKTPAGDWDVDGPSTNGDGWERSGYPPKVTVQPSILFEPAPGRGQGYHGWLTDGVLIEC